MSFTIALIKENEINDNELNAKITPQNIIIKKNELKNKINEFVNTIEVETPIKMMEIIVELIKMTPEMMGLTTTCYEDENYIYQLIHLDENISETKKINEIASLITYNKITIYGSAVLIKSMMNNKREWKTSSINIDDIKDLLDIRTHNKGILINSNSEYHEMEFVKDPIECCNIFVDLKNPNKKLKTNVMQICNFYIIAIYDPNETQLNELASVIYNTQMCGNVFLFIKNDEKDYINCDLEMFNKIKLIREKKQNIETKKYNYVTEQYRDLNKLLENI